jgi:hypothetical protein
MSYLRHNRIHGRPRVKVGLDNEKMHWFDLVFGGWMQGIKKIILTPSKPEGSAQ